MLHTFYHAHISMFDYKWKALTVKWKSEHPNWIKPATQHLQTVRLALQICQGFFPPRFFFFTLWECPTQKGWPDVANALPWNRKSCQMLNGWRELKFIKSHLHYKKLKNATDCTKTKKIIFEKRFGLTPSSVKKILQIYNDTPRKDLTTLRNSVNKWSIQNEKKPSLTCFLKCGCYGKVNWCEDIRIILCYFRQFWTVKGGFKRNLMYKHCHVPCIHVPVDNATEQKSQCRWITAENRTKEVTGHVIKGKLELK